MFPEAFAEGWIARLSKPGDVVLDPFCGRGTTPFQALLMGRGAIGCDINPVAYCVTRAKTNAPNVPTLKRRVTQLEGRFKSVNWSKEESALPAFFRAAFQSSTLRQVLYLRANLRWKTSDVDCMLAALTLGALHGESQKSPSYLSNQMPRTISTKPGYSLRFWQRYGLTPPQRDTFSVLRNLIDFRFASPPPKERAQTLNADFRELPRLLAGRPAVRLVVTSPPYLDVTNFEEDQWLRLWFLGGQPHPTYGKVSRDDRHEQPTKYWRLIADMWRVLGLLVEPKGHVVIRLGGRRLQPEQLVSGLQTSAIFSRRPVSLLSWELSEIQRRQTDAFRPGSKGCSFEVDCCFQLN
jgi:hypothetical protein